MSVRHELKALTIEQLAIMTYTTTRSLAGWLDVVDHDNNYDESYKVDFGESLAWIFHCIDLAYDAGNSILGDEIDDRKTDWLMSVYGV